MNVTMKKEAVHQMRTNVFHDNLLEDPDYDIDEESSIYSEEKVKIPILDAEAKKEEVALRKMNRRKRNRKTSPLSKKNTTTKRSRLSFYTTVGDPNTKATHPHHYGKFITAQRFLGTNSITDNSDDDVDNAE